MDLISDLNYKCALESLFNELEQLPSTWTRLEDASNTIHLLIQKYFRKFINCQSKCRQENETYNDSLFEALENLVLAVLHRDVFHLITEQFRKEDELIYKKCCDLSGMKVTADQLGAIEDYSIPLPASIVELASLDMHETPSEKLTCLSTAFDLAMAELKGAIADVYTINSDNKIPILNVSDITPILATIMIHAKPIHFVSNYYYIEHFHWCRLSNAESECLLAFKTAIDKLHVVTVDVLLPRSTRIYCDLGLEDVFHLTVSIDEKYDRKGQRISKSPANPLDRYVEHFTQMITTATLSNMAIM